MLQKEFQQELTREMRANHDRMSEVARALDPEQLVRRPAERSWSVGEVLEHLVLMDTLFLSAIEPLVRSSRPDAGAPAREYRQTFIGRQIVGALEKPKPLKTAGVADPGTPRNGVVSSFLAGDTQFIALMERASSLDWNAVRLRPPIMPWLPLKMNLGDVFHVHRVHVRRHLGQVERAASSLR